MQFRRSEYIGVLSAAFFSVGRAASEACCSAPAPCRERPQTGGVPAAPRDGVARIHGARAVHSAVSLRRGL